MIPRKQITGFNSGLITITIDDCEFQISQRMEYVRLNGLMYFFSEIDNYVPDESDEINSKIPHNYVIQSIDDIHKYSLNMKQYISKYPFKEALAKYRKLKAFL